MIDSHDVEGDVFEIFVLFVIAWLYVLHLCICAQFSQIPIKAARSKKNHLCARIGYSEGLADGGPVNDRGNNPLGPQVMQLDLSTEVDWKRILVLKEIGEGALRTRPSLVSKVLNRKEGAPLVERKKKSMGAVSSLMGGLRK